MIILNIWENKSNVPKHQPATFFQGPTVKQKKMRNMVEAQSSTGTWSKNSLGIQPIKYQCDLSSQSLGLNQINRFKGRIYGKNTGITCVQPSYYHFWRLLSNGIIIPKMLRENMICTHEQPTHFVIFVMLLPEFSWQIHWTPDDSQGCRNGHGLSGELLHLLAISPHFSVQGAQHVITSDGLGHNVRGGATGSSAEFSLRWT